MLPRLLGTVGTAACNSFYLHCGLLGCWDFLIRMFKQSTLFGFYLGGEKIKGKVSPETSLSVPERRAEVQLCATSIFSLKCSCPRTAFQTILVAAGALSQFSVDNTSVKNSFEVLIETEDRKEPNCPLLITATGSTKEKNRRYEIKPGAAGDFHLLRQLLSNSLQ